MLKMIWIDPEEMGEGVLNRSIANKVGAMGGKIHKTLMMQGFCCVPRSEERSQGKLYPRSRLCCIDRESRSFGNRATNQSALVTESFSTKLM